MYIRHLDSSTGIHVRDGVGDAGGALACLYIFPGYIELDALQPGSLSCAQDPNSGDKAVSNSIRFSSNGLETDSVLRLAFQPDSSVSVSSAEFTCYIKEPPNIDVASSAAGDTKAVPEREDKSVTPLVDETQDGTDAIDGPGGDVLIKRSMIEITQRNVKGHIRHQLRTDDSLNTQGPLSVMDRILDTPAMQTRYIDPQVVNNQCLEFDASAAQTVPTDTGTTQSGSGVTSIQDLPADVPETEAVPESDQLDIRSPSRDEEMSPGGRSISRETPAVREDSPVQEKPETPTPGQSEEFFSAPTYPSSRKRKHVLTYTSVTRSSKKKRKAESAAVEEDNSAKANTEGNAESTIVLTSLPPSKHAEHTPKTSSGRTRETSSGLKKKKQQQEQQQQKQPKRTRLSGSSADSTGKYEGPAPRVVFSNSTIPSQSKYMNFLKKQNVKTVDAISNSTTDMVCVGDGELKRTAKLTLGVSLGKTIVTDKWVLDSYQAGQLLNPTPYLPHDPEHETKWNFSLHDAIERGKQGIKVFADWTIHLTPSIVHQESKDTIKELSLLVHAAGGRVVSNRGPPKDSPPATDEASSTLLIAAAGADDDDTKSLANSGWSLYTRDIIPLSILRGKVEVDSEEFKIHVNSGISGRASGVRKEKRVR